MRSVSYNKSMAYTSLYRKYRPSSFDEVIGQDTVVRILRNMVSAGSIAHAYLFTGTRGTGKTSVARIFAKAVNCLSPVDGSPCGQCAACKSIESGTMDFIELDAASNNGVDDIRALRESVKYPPSDERLRYKVYIIDEVHQLSPQAFNAFLKTLEEPPAYCIFILATTEVQKLPQTILSRCLRFDFRTVSQEDLAAHIERIFDKEGVKYEKEAVWCIAQAGAGSVRDTMSVADTCMSASDGFVTYQKVLGVLGASDPTLIADVAECILKGDLARSLSLVERNVSMGKNVNVLTKDITKYIRDLLIVKADPKANDYLKMPEDSYRRAKGIADDLDAVTLVRALDIFSGLDGNMRIAASPRTVLENAIARTATISGVNLTDLSARVSGVERKIDEVDKKIEEGVKVVAVAASAPVTESKTVETNENTAAVATDNLTAVDNPFDEEAGAAVPISTTPDDYMSVKAVSLKYRGNLITLLREKKMLMMGTIIDNAFITVKDNVVTFSVGDENDVDYLEKKRELLEKLTAEIMKGNYKLAFKFSPPKKKDEDFVSALAQIVGEDKITKK